MPYTYAELNPLDTVFNTLAVREHVKIWHAKAGYFADCVSEKF